MADEQNAASSSASVETPSKENAEPETWSSEQRADWLKSGELPKAEAIKADDKPKEPSEAPSGQAPAKEAAKIEPEPEPGKQQEPKTAPGEKRKGQLANEIQQLLRQRAVLRQENERVLAERAVKTTASPAEPITSELKEPEAEDYGNWEDFRKAEREYQQADTQRQIQEALAADRQEKELAAQAAATEKRNQAIEQGWSKRTREFKTGHPEAKDFDAAVEAMVNSGLIPENSFLDQWILHSDHGPALAWNFSQSPEEILRIGELHPIAASRELAKLENSFEIKKEVPASQQRGAAHKPPVTVSARAAAPADEVEAAVESDDTRGYIDAMNRRELAAKKG